jgi:uncharacterized protein (TIGR02145 family)
VSYTPSKILQLSEAEIKEIENPDDVQIVYNTTAQKFYSYSYTIGLWIEMNDSEVSESELDANCSFSCGSLFIDERDGQSYQTVMIGKQCWMAENLNVGTYIQGSQTQEDNSTVEKYCYEDSESNCKIYGGLYQWDEMMDYAKRNSSKGICPAGWHVPCDKEWKRMERTIGMTSREVNGFEWRGTKQGSELKGNIESALWISNTHSQYNFNALPGGYRHSQGKFNSVEINSVFWSSTGEDHDAITRYLFSNYMKEGRDYFDKSYGFSVRCVKDQFTFYNSLQAILY